MDEDFAREIYRSLILDYVEERLQSFGSIDLSQIKDGGFLKVASLYQSLPEEGKDQFAETLRQTAVDTLGGIFGIIQGYSYLENFNEDEFSLTYGGVQLGRDIADVFLAEDETARRR